MRENEWITKEFKEKMAEKLHVAAKVLFDHAGKIALAGAVTGGVIACALLLIYAWPVMFVVAGAVALFYPLIGVSEVTLAAAIGGLATLGLDVLVSVVLDSMSNAIKPDAKLDISSDEVASLYSNNNPFYTSLTDKTTTANLLPLLQSASSDLDASSCRTEQGASHDEDKKISGYQHQHKHKHKVAIKHSSKDAVDLDELAYRAPSPRASI